MTFPESGAVQQAFATPLLSCVWPDSEAVNASLLRTIADKRKESAGIQRSLSGGWHSELDFFEWGTDAVAEIADRVYTCFERITQESASRGGTMSGSLALYGWANVTFPGGYNRVHNHAEAMWSGVYYVAVGTAAPEFPDSGVLEFLDPRLGANMIDTPGRPFGGNLRIVPEPGLMVLFPSWLAHFVNPFNGTGERVSVSFNIRAARAPGSPRG